MRAKLERSFGSDLSHIRMHTSEKADILNRSLTSRAFTVGNDIFFTRGGEKDLKLTAHEVAHTFQQAGGTTAQREIIRRDVGFEYAISWRAQQRQWWGEPKPYGKKHELYTSPDYNMETDGSDIEFVVHPIKDRDGERGVVRVFNSLERHVDSMEQARNLAQVTEGTDLLRPPLSFVNTNDSWLEIDTQGDDVKGAPQATIGVKLESVPQLYQSLSDVDNKANEELIGMDGGFKTHAIKLGKAVSYQWPTVNGNQASAKLKGLMTMVALVLNQGAAPYAGAAATTVKYLMIMMSRTQFGHLFSKLEDEEKTYFSQNPDQFVTYVCGTLRLNPDENVITWKIHDGRNLQNRSDTTRGYWPFTWKGQDQRITIDIKRRAWLTAMTEGRDLLTAEENPIGYFQNKRQFQDTRGLGHRLRGLGGLGNQMDSLADGGEGAIMEMRVMEKPVPYREWKEQAVSIFRYVRALNAQGGRAATPKYKRADLAQEERLKEDSSRARGLNFWGPSAGGA